MAVLWTAFVTGRATARRPNAKVQPRQLPAQPPELAQDMEAIGVSCNALYDCSVGGRLNAKPSAHTAGAQALLLLPSRTDVTRSLAKRSTTDEESYFQNFSGQTMGRKGVESRLLFWEQEKDTTRMLGIDVAKDRLACTLLDPKTRKTLWRRNIPNTPAGIQTLLGTSPTDAPWVIEPTGRYSTPVATLARQAHRNVLLAPPRQAKSFLRSIQCRAKTDKLDSEGLALFALSQPLAPYPLKTPMQEKIDQLLLARRGMARAAASFGQQSKELPHAKEPLEAALAEIKAQIKVLNKEIAALITQPELAAAARLRQVPGIGPVTAAALASRLAGKQFLHPDKLVAYIGLDIGVQQSGRKKGERGLTKHGDAELRRLLFLCASASLLSRNTGFKEQYEREGAKGLPSTAALCAVARKMAKVCWSIVQHGSVYDPARVYQQPKMKTEKETASTEKETASTEKETASEVPRTFDIEP